MSTAFLSSRARATLILQPPQHHPPGARPERRPNKRWTHPTGNRVPKVTSTSSSVWSLLPPSLLLCICVKLLLYQPAKYGCRLLEEGAQHNAPRGERPTQVSARRTTVAAAANRPRRHPSTSRDGCLPHPKTTPWKITPASSLVLCPWKEPKTPIVRGELPRRRVEACGAGRR